MNATHDKIIPLHGIQVFATSVEGLADSNEDLNTGSVTTSMPSTSDSVTPNPTSASLQPQSPSKPAASTTSNAGGARSSLSVSPSIFSTEGSSLHFLSPDNAFGKAITKHGGTIDPVGHDVVDVGPFVPMKAAAAAEDTRQDTNSQSVKAIFNTAIGPGTAYPPVTMTSWSVSPVTKSSHSTSIPSPSFDTQLGLDQVEEAISILELIPSSSQGVFSKTTTAFSSGASNEVLPVHTPSAQRPLTSKSSILSSSSASVKSENSSISPSLTINGQIATAHSTCSYLDNNQTLISSDTIAVSGMNFALAPTRSDSTVLSTWTLGPSVTPKLGSAPTGTEVQKFTGDALGVRDGSWSSSVMLVLVVVVLLRM